VFETTVKKLTEVCHELSIGMITVDNYVYVNKVTTEYDNAFSLLELYVNDSGIEDKVLSYIKENQPTTKYTIAQELGYSREVIWRILDSITFKDVKLWEHPVGKVDMLFYGEELAEEYDTV
jgi:predicted HTH transcriptional regulator